MTTHHETAFDDAAAAGDLWRAIERLLRRVLREEMHGQEPGWVEQAASPLGPKRHCAAVRRRIAERKPGARIVGRRFLLSQEAMAEELGRESERRGGRPPLKKTSAGSERAANDATAEDLDPALLAKLGVR